jgi:bifunctional DNA-binding transcriptional regulator/antitoxin component of YhaV-PrlF toxin-antitoxin module
MLKKRISVSQKRQITIPIEFFNSIGIDKEVDCYVQNNAIVIRSVREGVGEFDEQILADLIRNVPDGFRIYNMLYFPAELHNQTASIKAALKASGER